MKISIITPTYNSATTLSRTIESVINQKYIDLEYIIFDGNSTDNTAEIVKEYQHKINIKFVSEDDDGIYDAMNKGIQLATGEIIGILNSDDLFENNSVLQDVREAFSDKNIDAVYGDIKYFSNDENKITRHWVAGEYSESNLNHGWTIPHPALFVRKSVYDKCGLFNTDLKIAADYEFILRILKVHHIQVKYIPKTFVKMFNGGTSGKNLKQRINGWKELKKSWKINNLKFPFCFICRRIFSKLNQFLHL
jgi:glycosyltransferase involved in cell wall biosynthesis